MAPARRRRSHGCPGRRWRHSTAKTALLAVAGLCALPTKLFVPAPSLCKTPQRASLVQPPQLPQLPQGAAVAALFTSSIATQAAELPVDTLTPDNFRPVCPASDGLYNVGKGLADSLLGTEGLEYRPLAIEALLRVRLEVCVLESFIYEAIVPFVQRKGLGWVLPFHETLDTVIAGTVFAVAINFILFGTTKILAVISIYHDFLVGAPLRLVGFALLPEPRKAEPPPLIQINWPGTAPPEPEPRVEEEQKEEEAEPSQLPVPVQVLAGLCKAYGIFAGVLKDFLEGLDTFVGRYLVLVSITYVAFKWAHFRLFPDFPPF